MFPLSFFQPVFSIDAFVPWPLEADFVRVEINLIEFELVVKFLSEI